MTTDASRDVILAVDQGTTSTKCVGLAHDGSVCFTTAAVPVSLLAPKQEWIEQAPEELWESVARTLGEGARLCREQGLEVRGIAISNQRETAVAWERESGRAVGNAIGWQCRRSEAICRELQPSAARFTATTGLMLDPLVTAGKWSWLLKENETAAALAKDGRLCLGTVDAWLVHRLTGGRVHATDHTNASRTGLMNLRALAWDDAMLDAFGIPKNALPELRFSAAGFGECTAIAAVEGVPIVCAVGDSHAALAAYGVGDAVKATYGTGSSLMAAVDALPDDAKALARTVAWSTRDEVRYALEGNIAMTGAAVRWVGEFLGLARPVEDVVALAATVDDSAGVVLVPAMAGLGAPYWDAAARGTISNLGPWHKAAHLARAALDAIGMQVADVFEAMEAAAGRRFEALNADGGATRNRALMQMQADVLGRDVLRSQMEELSAVGAARLGGITLGWWRSLAEAAQVSASAQPEMFHAAMSTEERERVRGQWKAAVARTLSARCA